jgi:serine phosphatase RsbU (regulator of sigma subunit)
MMDAGEEYRRRLADLDAAVARARMQPEAVVQSAAGLLAGRVGCRVSEAHAHLLGLASEQGRAAAEVAAELLDALEGPDGAAARRLRAATDQAVAAHRAWPRGRRWPRLRGEPVGDWAAMMQQILDAVPGEHTALLPVHDEGGEVADWLLAAASPAMSDLSGRRGPDLVGRRISEVYPTVVDGPVWRAWRDALADGRPREVGPIPYTAAAERAPAQITLTVQVHPVGPGLLNSWVRHDEQTRLSERIAQTERLGQLGWGEADLVTGAILWSAELYRIYERDPGDGPLSGEEQDALTLPEDEPIRRQAVEAFAHGQTIDITYRVRIGGGIKHLRTIVDAVRDRQGRPVKIYGIVQDVTARETTRTRLAHVEAQLAAHQRQLAAEHLLAARLQQIVLPIPAGPVDLPGLRVAVRYLPAEQASRVGGDWYHADATDDGAVVLAIGDVTGHGIRAAATMVQLRQALAALAALTTTDPAGLLSYLNRLLYKSDGGATALVARYHPTTATLLWAQAGHPTPLRGHAGATTTLDRPHGTMLGVLPDVRYDTAATTIGPDEVLLFYTDGLIEHRDRSLAEGLAPVIATLNQITGSATKAPLADILNQLDRANPEDDTCILAIRRLAN